MDFPCSSSSTLKEKEEREEEGGGKKDKAPLQSATTGGRRPPNVELQVCTPDVLQHAKTRQESSLLPLRLVVVLVAVCVCVGSWYCSWPEVERFSSLPSSFCTWTCACTALFLARLNSLLTSIVPVTRPTQLSLSARGGIVLSLSNVDAFEQIPHQEKTQLEGQTATAIQRTTMTKLSSFSLSYDSFLFLLNLFPMLCFPSSLCIHTDVYSHTFLSIYLFIYPALSIYPASRSVCLSPSSSAYRCLSLPLSSILCLCRNMPRAAQPSFCKIPNSMRPCSGKSRGTTEKSFPENGHRPSTRQARSFRSQVSCIDTRIYLQSCLYVCMCVCINVYIYVYTCVCM